MIGTFVSSRPNLAGSPGAGARLKTGTASLNTPSGGLGMFRVTIPTPTAVSAGQAFTLLDPIVEKSTSLHSGVACGSPNRPGWQFECEVPCQRGRRGQQLGLCHALSARAPASRSRTLVIWNGCEPASTSRPPPSSSGSSSYRSTPNGVAPPPTEIGTDTGPAPGNTPPPNGSPPCTDASSAPPLTAAASTSTGTDSRSSQKVPAGCVLRGRRAAQLACGRVLRPCIRACSALPSVVCFQFRFDWRRQHRRHPQPWCKTVVSTTGCAPLPTSGHPRRCSPSRLPSLRRRPPGPTGAVFESSRHTAPANAGAAPTAANVSVSAMETSRPPRRLACRDHSPWAPRGAARVAALVDGWVALVGSVFAGTRLVPVLKRARQA